MFSTDQVLAVGLKFESEDMVHRIRGVGGSEIVFTKCVDCLAVGELQVQNFEIEVGAMDYGCAIDEIIGMDFLVRVGAIIDLDCLEIYAAR